MDVVIKAKDVNIKNMPDIILENKTKLCPEDHATAFANFFSIKVNTIVNQTQIDPGVFNGIKTSH